MECGPASASTAAPLPQDLRPLILCGPSILEKDALMRKLWDILPDSFAIAAYHTTSSPSDGQVSSDSQNCISSVEFINMISNGDFALYDTYGDFSIGILKQTIAAGTATQRIVVIDVNMRGVQQLKADPGFDARYVFFTPPSLHVSEARMRPRLSETGEIGIYEPLRRAVAELGCTRDLVAEEAELEYAHDPEIYDLIIPSENLDEAFQSLVAFIYGSDN